MRVELENRFKTRRIAITTKNNKKLDCIFIYSTAEEIRRKLQTTATTENDSSNLKVDISLESDQYDHSNSGSVILFCNPNGGYYEYMYYEVILKILHFFFFQFLISLKILRKKVTNNEATI